MKKKLWSAGALGLLAVLGWSVHSSSSVSLSHLFSSSLTSGSVSKVTVKKQKATVVLSRESAVFAVARVVDGDTIVVSTPDGDETVRLIGINTPETVDPRKPVQCFGKEASDKMKILLPPGTQVRLESDPTQDNTDKYGRILRYVYTDELINKKMIEDGYAYEYTYHVPYQFQSDFKKAEADARTSARGLWATDTCGGKLL